MKNVFYYKLDKQNNPVPGTLLAFTSKPKDGRWVRLGGTQCCGEISRTRAVESGTIASAVSAAVVIGCSGATGQATLTVTLTAGNSALVKRTAILTAIQKAYGPFTTFFMSGTTIYADGGIKCPTGIVFTITYS